MSHAPRIAFCFVLLGTFGWAPLACANGLVVIWLADGRMLAGEVDPRTNDERLWLRSAAPTFVIATSAAWEQIKAVNANGERLSVATFSQRVDEFRPQKPDPRAQPAPPRETPANVTTPVMRSISQSNAATRVVSLDVEAHVANWDQDAATDGIELRVYPRNTFGQMVPVSGQVTATLVARNQLPAHDRKAFPQLGQWSLHTDTSDFGPQGAVYRLPFRGQHPDEQFSLEPHGLVEVSLYALGHGRFTSDATVYIRGFNPVRRDLQRHARERDY